MSNASITIVGNLTADPEFTTLASGTSKASFSVAVPHRYQKAGEWQEDTSFLNVIAWGTLADEVSRLLEKGIGVIVTGRMSQRSYEGDDGKRRYVYEIVADNVAINIRRLESYERRVSSGSYASSQASTVSDDEAPW